MTPAKNGPRYLELHENGVLIQRIEEAIARLSDCDLCPHVCHVDRNTEQRGICRGGRLAQVASYNLHYGEESPLVGRHGSGTIFFAGCNLHCHFCQNYDISHLVNRAYEVSPKKLAQVMLSLQRRGAHNINLVTPSHVVAQILEALPFAINDGLDLPLVYNSSAYDSLLTLQLLDGVVDIYMPDAKFIDAEVAARFSEAPDYPEKAREAIAEMFRQVGDLELDDHGIATSGLLVRHLVMPKGTSGTFEWMQFLANLSRGTYVNIMGQYHPCGRVLSQPTDFTELRRSVSDDEMEAAYQAAARAGITRLDERRTSGRHILLRMLDPD